MIPTNPDFRQTVSAAMDAQPFAALLGIRLGDVEPGQVTMHIATDERHLQHDGIVHGGVLSSLADVGAALAAYTLMPADARVVSVEFKISFLRPAAADPLVCRGMVLRSGRRLSFAEAEIFSEREGGEILVAKALLTAAAVSPGER